jgi:hypothetical protein
VVVASQCVWLAPFEIGDHWGRILAQFTDGDRLHGANVSENYLPLSTMFVHKQHLHFPSAIPQNSNRRVVLVGAAATQASFPMSK